VGYRLTTGDKNLLVQVATLYAYSHNSYIFDRILANLKPKRFKIARKLYSSAKARLGAPFRFVSNQALYNASWLSFRSVRTRDKPQEFDEKDLSFLPTIRKKGGKKRKLLLVDSPYLKALDWTKAARYVANKDGSYDFSQLFD